MARPRGHRARRWRRSTRSRSRRRVLANIRPSGAYLMEDFYYAGGLRGAAQAASRGLLHVDARTVNGKHARRECRRRDRSTTTTSSCRSTSRCRVRRRLAVLRGNLAPDGGVIKPHRRRTAICCSNRARRSSSRTTPTWRPASTTRCSTSTPNSVLVLQQRRADRRARACRNGACCRSRRSC